MTVRGVAGQSAIERGMPSATAVAPLFDPHFLSLSFLSYQSELEPGWTV